MDLLDGQNVRVDLETRLENTWLGLSYIHRLTTSASQDLRVDMEDFEGGSAYAHSLYQLLLIATDY